MAENQADFTLTFRRLCDAAVDRDAGAAVRILFKNPLAFEDWAVKWRERSSGEHVTPDDRRRAMRAVNPLFIPRNHRVEQAISAALNDDLVPFETLLTVLANPFGDQPEFAAYTEPPRPEEVVHRTFCGT